MSQITAGVAMRSEHASCKAVPVGVPARDPRHLPPRGAPVSQGSIYSLYTWAASPCGRKYTVVSVVIRGLLIQLSWTKPRVIIGQQCASQLCDENYQVGQNSVTPTVQSAQLSEGSLVRGSTSPRFQLYRVRVRHLTDGQVDPRTTDYRPSQ